MEEGEKTRTEFHAPAHAICSVFQTNTDTILKETICPRRLVLEIVKQLPDRYQGHYSRAKRVSRKIILLRRLD